MPEYQIILLPRQNYWDWVRACRDYVQAFGTSLTPDPDTAGRTMAPNQTVTIVQAPDGYPAQGDITAWFRQRYPAARLDLVPASTPAELEERLQGRIHSQDRYGQSTQAFRLGWPTDYATITQPFGANPEIYGRFGLPGHEGLDIRAPLNANVYACADGVVFQVHENPKDHNYGTHIRIQHREGYLTIYGHLARTLVQAGEPVVAGQKIGLADSTGNSTGSHLHLGLKKEGATANRQTTYPNDLIDPTPFMIWPGQRTEAPRQPYAYNWPAGLCLVGVNARPDGVFAEADFKAIQAARVEAVRIPRTTTVEAIARLRHDRPNPFFLVVLGTDMNARALSPEEFVQQVQADMQRLHEEGGVTYFQVHRDPNLQSEGWGRSWMSGRDFTVWFLEVYNRLHQICPEARLGFPGLSPGGQVEGQRQDWLGFLEETDAAVVAADWVGVNSYWQSRPDMLSPDKGRVHESYRLRYPSQVLVLCEFANINPGIQPVERGEEYVAYYADLRRRPGYAAAFANILSAARGFEHQVWRLENGDLSPIPSVLGRRL